MTDDQKQSLRRDQLRKAQARYRLRHPGKILAYQRKRRKLVRRRTIRRPSQLRARMKYHAKKENLGFDLPRTFLTDKGLNCGICFDPIDVVRVIRKDHLRGYTSENVLRVCRRCYGVFKSWRYLAVSTRGREKTYQSFIEYCKTVCGMRAVLMKLGQAEGLLMAYRVKYGTDISIEGRSEGRNETNNS